MATSITAPPFSGESDFTKETTPAFGAAGDWGSEKTILVADDPAQVHAAWLQNVDSGEWYTVDKFPVTIGRHEACDLRINDGSLSRQHASIFKLDDGAVVIEDSGSTNGIKVNDCKVDRVILAAGDQVTLGNLGLTFHLTGPDGQGAAPAPVPSSSANEQNSFQTLITGIGSLWRQGVAKLSQSVKQTTAKSEGGSAGAIQWAKAHPGTSVFLGALLVLLPAGFLYNQTVLERVVPVPAAADPTAVAGDTEVAPAPSPDAPEDQTASATPDTGEGAAAVPVFDNGELEVSVTELVPPPTEEPLLQAAVEPPAATATAVPAKPKRPRPRLVPAAQSEKQIANSLALYAGGSAPDALSQLDEIALSKTHRRQYREEAGELRTRIGAAFSDYEKGEQALEAGDKNLAFASWLEFLNKEADLLDGHKSAYARDINDAVVREYTNQGNTAEKEERYQDAHRSWRQAAQLEPAGVAAAAIERLQLLAKHHYLEGYRLESVNINKAREHWLKAVSMAAPATEYSTKARAKLRWHGAGGGNQGS